MNKETDDHTPPPDPIQVAPYKHRLERRYQKHPREHALTWDMKIKDPKEKDRLLKKHIDKTLEKENIKRGSLLKLYDNFERLIGETPLPASTDKTLMMIRRLLCMPTNRNALFAKCDRRDSRKALQLDLSLGYTMEDVQDTDKGHHTKRRHLCSECRCHHTAGWGSRGWWYWPPESGLPEVGHYGVGPCFIHGPFYHNLGYGWAKGNDAYFNVDKYRNYIMKRIQAMQQYGLAPDSNAGYLIDMRDDAADAKLRIDTNTAMQALYNLANETITALRKHRDTDKAKELFLKEVCDVFAIPSNMLAPEDRDRLLQASLMRPLTEYISGKLVPMSDKTALSIESKMLNDVVKAAKSTFDVHEDRYTSNDQVLLLLEKFYISAETYLKAEAGEDGWTKFIGALKDIGRGFDAASISVTASEEGE